MEVIEPSSQTWRTFLASHLGQIVATDFFAMPTATCRLLFVLVILDDGDGVVLRDRHLEIRSQRNREHGDHYEEHGHDLTIEALCRELMVTVSCLCQHSSPFIPPQSTT